MYLDSITRGCIFITSHQLRIHKCVGLHLYVKVNGHPIIEDCKEMCFAPYRVAYAGFGQDLKSAKLEDAKCWDNVVDFRCGTAPRSRQIGGSWMQRSGRCMKWSRARRARQCGASLQRSTTPPAIPAAGVQVSAPLPPPPADDDDNGDIEESDDEL